MVTSGPQCWPREISGERDGNSDFSNEMEK